MLSRLLHPRWLKRRHLRQSLQKATHKKVIIGAGKTRYPGWIATDKDILDVTIDKSWAKISPPGAIDCLLAEHVWEHLADEDALRALQCAYRYLRKGGCLRIAVPDGNFPSSEYIERVRPGGKGPGADDHKRLYDFDSLSALCKQAGFTVVLLEAWNNNGQFIETAWNPDHGPIKRSRYNDPRNEKEISYTSLLIDAVKP